VSKPSRRVQMDVGELRRLCSGRSAKTVAPLGMGEVAVVKTRDREHEWLEAREALRLGLDGEVVCRAS
jgi:ribosomal protein S8